MNQKNLEFLHRNLKYLGFGENTLLNQQLEQHIALEEPEFELYTDAFLDQFMRIEAKLKFTRKQQKDLPDFYVFNHYTATLQYEQDPGRNKERTFHIYKGIGVTFKEAFNLLDGRAARVDMVNSDGEKYNVWVQLDFEEKDVHQNYRFRYYRFYDLERLLTNYPIAECHDEPSRDKLISALERGNRHLVMFETAKPEPKWIEANPAERTIRIYTPEPNAARKRGAEARRTRIRRTPQAADPASEKTVEDQELSEETTAIPGAIPGK
jgi:hypothetical protein